MTNHIDRLIEDSLSRSLSSLEEKIIFDYFKSMNEEDACQIIKKMIDTRSLITMQVAIKIVRRKENVIEIFKYGVLVSNAQSIRMWLNFAVPKVGFKAIVDILLSLDNQENKIIEKALYWLPSIIPEDNKKSQQLLQKLKNYIDKVS
jgi:hypothetical protein